MNGGFLPKVPGRPSNILKKMAIAPILNIPLFRKESVYNPVVEEGQRVQLGDILAKTVFEENKQQFFLPSPADGSVHLVADSDSKEIISIKLTDINPSVSSDSNITKDPSRLSPAEAKKILLENGIWDYLWSSGAKGIPDLNAADKPKSIIINTIISEPFRTRGNVILKHFWHNIIKGVSYLNILLADYGTIDFILTQKRDPIVKLILKDLKGKSNVKFHFTDVKYPIENPEVLHGLIYKSKSNITFDDEIWLLNIQTVEAIGTCLGNGISLCKRIVALSGPAFPDPMHVNVRIGTPLKHIIPDSVDLSSIIVLRGGLMLGELVDPENTNINFDDDAFLFLPKKDKRDFVTFVRPGFNKRSIFPNFAGRIDRDISDQLRGELRPCIACCKCQEVCPVDLMPQIIHRYLYRDNLDEARKLGLDNCINCNLCTFVCPSKIELKMQFDEARIQLRIEEEETK